MLIDRPKEEIARDLRARAINVWGAERAEALRAHIEEAASCLALIGRHPMALDGEEPDFLGAPIPGRGGE